MRSRRRSPLRNEFEVSPQIFWAECSTRWLSAQHFRSIIQPNYHQALGTPRIQLGARLALPHLQAYYERLGYHVVGYETHAGYTAPTAVVMEKQVL